jgi:lysylphosphatidylglycerol synthetase-like protein (DUF2156 family)
MWRARLASMVTPEHLENLLLWVMAYCAVMGVITHGLWPTLVVFWFAMLVSYIVCTVLSWCRFWPASGANPWDR